MPYHQKQENIFKCLTQNYKLDKNCVEFERRCRLRKTACYTFENGIIFHSIFIHIDRIGINECHTLDVI